MFSKIIKEFRSAKKMRNLRKTPVRVYNWSTYKNSLRMYVLVKRDSLPLVNCAVQATHAVAEYIHYHDNENTKKWVEQDKTLIILEATDEQLEAMRVKFLELDWNYQPFWEPDLDNMLTCIAFQPISTELGMEWFSHLKLLS